MNNVLVCEQLVKEYQQGPQVTQVLTASYLPLLVAPVVGKVRFCTLPAR
jgi:hypothetical protein